MGIPMSIQKNPKWVFAVWIAKRGKIFLGFGVRVSIYFSIDLLSPLVS